MPFCSMAIINYCIYTRRFVLKKINKEFEELMLTKTEGRMIEQLTVSTLFSPMPSSVS